MRGTETSMTNDRLGKRLQITAVLIIAFISIGWGSSWEELKSTTGIVDSVSAEFIQEKHMRILVRPLVSSGVFYFQAPASLRWEYQKPLKNILIMHGNRIERYVVTEDGIIKESGGNLQAMQVVLEQISQWLGGRFDENPMFSAKLEPGSKIILAPKEEAFAKMIRRIELELSQRAGVIDTVTIYETDDSFTRLIFKNTVLNKPLNDALFRTLS